MITDLSEWRGPRGSGGAAPCLRAYFPYTRSDD
jgi:hypothetical protein